MKKPLIILAIVCIATLSAQALDLKLSAGGGMGFSFVETVSTDEGDYLPVSSTTYKRVIRYPLAQMNFQAFFDANYLMMRVAFATKIGDARTIDHYTTSSGTDTINETVYTYTYQALDMDLYAKFPLRVTRSLQAFPALGMRCSLNLDATDKADMTEQEKSDLNDWYFLLGAGADYSLTKKLYVRGLASLGFNLTPRPTGNTLDSWAGTAWSIDLLFGYRF